MVGLTEAPPQHSPDYAYWCKVQSVFIVWVYSMLINSKVSSSNSKYNAYKYYSEVFLMWYKYNKNTPFSHYLKKNRII